MVGNPRGRTVYGNVQHSVGNSLVGPETTGSWRDREDETRGRTLLFIREQPNFSEQGVPKRRQ